MADRARRVILIAIGNPLRRDDGAAQRVLELLGDNFPGERRSVLQLTPELAEEIAGFEIVVFLDADAEAADLSLEGLPVPSRNGRLTHTSDPAEIVALSSALFGFTGKALLCRIPASDFGHGEGLSATCESAAQEAAQKLALDAYRNL